MTAVSPDRGEIWLVCFDPSTRDEIKKTRPAEVVSSPTLVRLRLRIVVPITGWHPHTSKIPWHYLIKAGTATGLDKDSAADALQIKSMSLDRFLKKIGRVSATDLEEIISAVQMLNRAGFSGEVII